MSDSEALISLADLLLKGGIGLSLIKATWEIGKANTYLAERIAKLEKDVEWLRQIVGTRQNDKK